MKQNEIKMDQIEKEIVTIHNDKTVVDCSSDVSDNQEYEDDFEVKNR
jgi:hypothetical protein